MTKATQTEIKASINSIAQCLISQGRLPDYSEITRGIYLCLGLLEAYENHKSSGLKVSFMSTLPE